jgi:hypothetical protein
MANATATAANGDKGQQIVSMRPFITGTRTIDRAIYDNTTTQLTTPVKLPTYSLDTDGFTSLLYVIMTCTTAANAATVAYNADGIFPAIQSIQFSDTNNKPILGPVTGHDLYLINKYGGYSFNDDPKASPAYSATTGAGGTGGSWKFVLRVPIEIVHRDGFGSLLNKSASAVYKLDITLAGSGDVYATAPTTLGSVRTRIQQVGWMDSDQQDVYKNAADPNPPALNSIQYWDKQTLVVGTGSMNQQLNTFSGLVRNLIFELRTSTGARSENDWPDPFELHYDKTVPVSRLKDAWREMNSDDFGYPGGTESLTGTNTLDTGVRALPFTKDYGLKPGAESRFGYLPVTSATSLVMRGTVGSTDSANAHTFNVFVNYVWPANGDPKSITPGQR